MAKWTKASVRTMSKNPQPYGTIDHKTIGFKKN